MQVGQDDLDIPIIVTLFFPPATPGAKCSPLCRRLQGALYCRFVGYIMCVRRAVTASPQSSRLATCASHLLEMWRDLFAQNNRAHLLAERLFKVHRMFLLHGENVP